MFSAERQVSRTHPPPVILNVGPRAGVHRLRWSSRGGVSVCAFLSWSSSIVSVAARGMNRLLPPRTPLHTRKTVSGHPIARAPASSVTSAYINFLAPSIWAMQQRL
jgi:hypothetical protein